LGWQAALPNRQERLNPGMIHDDWLSRRPPDRFDHLVDPGDRPVEFCATALTGPAAFVLSKRLQEKGLRAHVRRPAPLALPLL
jgi:hypothetical protein